MTFISIDADGLKTFATNLRTWAQDADDSRQGLSTRNNQEDDPAHIWDDISSTSIMATHLANIETIADDLDTRRQEAEAMNANGVTTTAPDGTISYYLPDDVTDTADNVTTYNTAAYNQATTDARSLQQALNNQQADDGRTYDEIIAEMTSHQDNTTYALVFINTIGVAEFMDLPQAAQAHHTSFLPGGDNYTTKMEEDVAATTADITVLGHILAAASQRDEDLAGQVYDAVRADGHFNRMSGLNALLMTPDVTFSDGFVLDLANSLDDLPYDGMTVEQAERWPNVDDYGQGVHGYTLDPLAVIMTVVAGRPGLSLDYLAPAAADGGTDTTCLETLTERDWDDEGLARLTAVIAAASSQRASQDGAIRARADDLAGQAIADLVANTTDKEYNDDTKANIGLLLANCPAELTEAWNGGALANTGNNTELRAGSADDASELAYRVVDNADAATTISAQIAQYARDLSQARIQERAGDPTRQVDGISEAYNRAGQAAGYLAGLAEARAGELSEESETDAKNATANAQLVFSTLSTVIGAGLGSVGGPVGTVAGSAAGKTAWSVASTLTKPLVSVDPQAFTSTFDGNDMDDNLRAAAVQDAANAGLLQSTDFDITATYDAGGDEVTHYYWLVDNGDGTHSIDLSQTPPGDVSQQLEEDGKDNNVPEQITTWSNTIAASDNPDEILAKISEKFDGRYDTGKREAANSFKSRNPDE